MKRFLIFLITIVITLILFVILAVNFRALGLYIAMTVFALLTFIMGLTLLICIIRIRLLSHDLQNGEPQKIVKVAAVINRFIFSHDENIELLLWKALAYALLDDKINCQSCLVRIARSDMKNSRLLNLYYYARRLDCLVCRDRLKYQEYSQEYSDLCLKIDPVVANDLALGEEVLYLAKGQYYRVRAEEIQAHIRNGDNNPRLIAEFYDLFRALRQINDTHDTSLKKEYTIPLCQHLFEETILLMKDRQSY